MKSKAWFLSKQIWLQEAGAAPRRVEVSINEIM